MVMTRPSNARAIQKLAINNRTLHRTLGRTVATAPQIFMVFVEKKVLNQIPKLVRTNLNFFVNDHVDRTVIES
jgi:hypothetical protein